MAELLAAEGGHLHEHNVPTDPWADALWAMDKVWWERYAAEAKANFCGELLTLSANPFGIKTARIEHYRNSGGGAVSLAIARGAKRIILLGYDMQKTGGMSHWHGDHPEGWVAQGRYPSGR